MLDTGHLMNGLDVRDEAEGIQKVMNALLKLSDNTIEKIRAVHFHCSTSGKYQKTHFGKNPPPYFKSLSYRKKFEDLMQYIPHIDEHRPFSDPSCQIIIDFLSPDFLVHELFSDSKEELHRKIQQQKSLLTKEFN